MARKSRKACAAGAGNPAAQEAPKQERSIYRAGLYGRLSLESEANRERGTIENQMEFLRKFAGGAPDIVVEKEYMDVSKTGTNFEREGFGEMMEDIRDGRINCVIVKDLSRLGRNYVESGCYVERVFPFFEVRFIAVTDGYDSATDGADLSVCMANIFNEFYSRDLAKKVKAAYRAHWKKGSNVSGNLAYGLMSDPQDMHHIIPDPDAAPVVRRIFEMFVEGGMTYAGIAAKLNEDGVTGPKAYKDLRRSKKLPGGYNPEWRAGTVSRMLCNPYYAGDSRHNQYGQDGFADRKQWMEPEENWIIVEDTHEPVVPRALYMKAQEKIMEIHAVSPKYGKKNGGELAARNFFKKKIVCGGCGSTMYLVKNSGGGASFVCGAHQTKKTCERRPVRENAVNDEVLRVIRAHMNVYVEKTELLKRLNSGEESVRKYDAISKEIRKLHREMEKLAEHRSRLYEDYAERIIDAEQYRTFADRDAAEEARLKRKLAEAEEYQTKYERDYCADRDWDSGIERYRNTRHLTEKMVEAFVEKIEVLSAGRMTVHLRYDDMLEDLVGYARERGETDDGKQ